MWWFSYLPGHPHSAPCYITLASTELKLLASGIERTPCFPSIWAAFKPCCLTARSTLPSSDRSPSSCWDRPTSSLALANNRRSLLYDRSQTNACCIGVSPVAFSVIQGYKDDVPLAASSSNQHLIVAHSSSCFSKQGTTNRKENDFSHHQWWAKQLFPLPPLHVEST